MAKFLTVYTATKDAMANMKNKSEEENKKGMNDWMAWMKSCGDAMIDAGNPVGQLIRVNAKGANEEHDDILGYSILEAENLEAAKELLKGYPWEEGFEVNLYECKPMPQ